MKPNLHFKTLIKTIALMSFVTITQVTAAASITIGGKGFTEQLLVAEMTSPIS